MCDKERVYKLIQLCADPLTTSEDRKAHYIKALEIVRNPSVKIKTVGFEEFWKSYPHKVAKGYAEKALVKALKETDLETILRGVEFYKRNKPDKVDWAHPASWLNAKRWEDGQYIEPVKIEKNWPDWKNELAKRIGEPAVMHWFKDVECFGGRLVCPNRLAYNWINERYSIDLKRVFGEFEMRIK